MASYSFARKRRFKFHLSATSILIIINVAAFIIFSILYNANHVWMNYLGLNPDNILHGKSLWTLLTSMFIHEPLPNITHILFNMISLFFVGSLLERIIGKRRYVWFYLASGIFAGLVFSVLAGFFGSSMLGSKLFGSPNIYGIGASGAIFGLLGVLVVLTPKNKISLIAGPLLAIILQYFLGSVITNSSLMTVISFILTIYIFASIFLIFSFNPKLYKFAVPIQMPFWVLPLAAIVPLVIAGLFVELPIGNSAHFGGLIAGLAYGFYLKHKFPNKTKMISKIFSR